MQNQRPLASHLGQPAQEKLPESARCLICPKHRSTIVCATRTNAAPTLVSSFVASARTRLAFFDKGPRLRAPVARPCFCSPWPRILHSLLPQVLEVSLEQYPLSARTSSGFLSGLFPDGLNQWRYLLFVVGRWRDVCLQSIESSARPRICVFVGPARTPPALSYARLRIGKVVLRFRCGLGLFRLLPRALGLFAARASNARRASPMRWIRAPAAATLPAVHPHADPAIAGILFRIGCSAWLSNFRTPSGSRFSVSRIRPITHRPCCCSHWPSPCCRPVHAASSSFPVPT